MKLNVIVRAQKREELEEKAYKAVFVKAALGRRKLEAKETPLYQHTTSGHSKNPKASRGPKVASKEKSLFFMFFKNIIISFNISNNIKYSSILKTYLAITFPTERLFEFHVR